MTDELRAVGLRVNHRAILEDRSYRLRAAETMRLAINQRSALEVDHDATCCAQEEWSVTALRLMHICGATR